MKLDTAKAVPGSRRRISRLRVPGRLFGVSTSVLNAAVLAVAATLWILSGQVEDQGASVALEPAAAPIAVPAFEPERAPPVAVRVRTLTAQPRVQAVVLRGVTEASRDVVVRAQTAGRIEAIEATRGARVEAGQPLVRIAADDRPARLAEAKALARQRRIEYQAARELATKGHRSETQVAAALAQYEAAQAAVARVEVEIGHTRIAAPFGGMLDERPVEIGDFVDVGDAVATIVDLDPVTLTAYVSENEIGKLKVGDPGRAVLTTGEELEGTIRYIGSSAHDETRTFRVEVEVPNPGHTVIDGVTAEIRLPVTDVPAHRMSPAVLTLDDAGRIGIKIVDENDIVRFVRARIVDDTDGGIWLAGLPHTVRVITVGQEFVKDGQKVAPQENGPAIAEGGDAPQ